MLEEALRLHCLEDQLKVEAVHLEHRVRRTERLEQKMMAQEEVHLARQEYQTKSQMEVEEEVHLVPEWHQEMSHYPYFGGSHELLQQQPLVDSILELPRNMT